MQDTVSHKWQDVDCKREQQNRFENTILISFYAQANRCQS